MHGHTRERERERETCVCVCVVCMMVRACMHVHSSHQASKGGQTLQGGKHACGVVWGKVASMKLKGCMAWQDGKHAFVVVCMLVGRACLGPCVSHVGWLRVCQEFIGVSLGFMTRV